VRRVVVLGAVGFFGGMVAQQLRKFGIAAQTASRRGGTDVQVDANDMASIRASLRVNDLVLDAAGPFQARSMALVEAAVDIGFDVIDINETLRYAEGVLSLAPQIKRAGIRVLSSASTVSAVAAAVIRHSGVTSPTKVTGFLAPASRHTARPGPAASLLRSVGQPVRVLCDGRFHELRGWSQSLCFRMPPPLGMIRGGVFETADAAYLPRVWRSLRNVTMYVDTNVPGFNALLGLAARRPGLHRLLERHVRWAGRLTRLFGSSAGGVGYLIEDASGRVARHAIVSPKNSFLAAIAPAVLAARAILDGSFEHRGLVLPDRHVEANELIRFLQANGITVLELP